MRVGISRRCSVRCRKILALCAVLLTVFSLLVFFTVRASPIFSVRAADAASQEVRRIVNEAAGAAFREDIGGLTAKTLDANGQISMISINSAEIVKLKAAFTSELISRLSDSTRTSIYISAGSLMRQSIFQGAGIRIPVKIIYGSVSDVDIQDEFVSAGINQTKHLVTLKVSITCAVVSAFMCDTREVEATLPLCENIIIGKVPQYYSDRAPYAVKGEIFNEQADHKSAY